MDIFNKIEEVMKTDLGQYAKLAHGYMTFPKLVGELSPWMEFRGKKMLNWSLNNYLGLGNHPEIRKTDAQAAEDWGLAYPMGSRMMTGNTIVHEKFEDQISEFMQKEDTMLMNFGYQGVMSIIPALTNRRDVIVYDQLSHACLIDGMSISLAKRFMFAHNDMAQLEDRLKKAERITQKTGGGILVITEGVFGMKGDLGKLDEIVALKSKYNFRILVDDAHGFGVMGEKGIGTGEFFGVHDQIDLVFCTFAKSMASIGAFVSAEANIIKFLRYNTRSQIYAKSLPMPLVVGGMKRLDMLQNEPGLREQLWTVVKKLQSGLKERGFDIGNTQSPVTPVYYDGSDVEAINMVMDLRENYKIFTSPVVYPVIEKGKIMLRLIPTASHTEEDVDITLNAFEEVRDKIKQGAYNKAQSIN